MEATAYTKEGIYVQLLDDIINLRHKPGEYIKEHDLADRFGLSRTPVREVIKRLALEGYIKISPRAGNSVTRIDIRHVRQMMQLRVVMESKVLIQLASTVDVSLGSLYTQLEQQQNMMGRADLTEDFWQADNLFHKTLFDLAERDIWWQVLEQFEPHYMRYRKLDMTDSNQIELLYVHHKNFMHIIEEKRIDEIEDILKSHIYCCVDRIPVLLEKYPQFFTNA